MTTSYLNTRAMYRSLYIRCGVDIQFCEAFRLVNKINKQM